MKGAPLQPRLPLGRLQLLTVLLALVVSAQGVSVIEVPGDSGYQGGDPTISAVNIEPDRPLWCGVANSAPYGATLTITNQGATEGPAYTLKCYAFDREDGEESTDCVDFNPLASISYDAANNNMQYQYFPSVPATYKFEICVGQSCLASTLFEVRRGACQITDPIIVGFDGKAFHFDDVGEFVMLESADGYKVHSTFAGATADNDAKETMEKSWTSSVRLISPNGDMVSCALPAIIPNTSRIQVTAAAVGSSEVDLLSPTKPSADLAEMSASVVLSEGTEPRQVTGCILTTPKLVIRVDQVSGYRQAQLHPDTESWAAPFTWLDTSFIVKKPLAGPVTGIIGATYPADMVAGQDLLHSDRESADETASMKGEEPAVNAHRRSLLSTSLFKFVPITSSIVGIGPASLSVAAP